MAVFASTAIADLAAPPQTRAAYQTAVFGGQLTFGPQVFVQPVLPSVMISTPQRAAYAPYMFGPNIAVTAPTPQPIQPILPPYLRGRPARAHEMPSFFAPQHLITPVTPAVLAYGASGTALILSLEPGTKTGYAWSTDITRTFSGLETRSSPFPNPKRRFEGAALMLDAPSRDARSALMRGAAVGATFLLAAPHEALGIAADSTGTTVTVASTALCDWAQPGQRVVIIGTDGTQVFGVVQSTTSTTIVIVVTSSTGALLFGSIGNAGRAGGQIMPLVQILLDAQQGFARYPVTFDAWSIRASASVFGWTGIDVMGAGATVTTYTQQAPVALSKITDADLLIWDRPNAIADTASESALSGAETLDLGALPTGFGDQTVTDWSRAILYSSSTLADWQWLKAFLRLCRGRQRAFLLSTNRADLIYVGSISSGIKVQSSSVAGAGDYASWWISQAHRRLAFTMADGSIQYGTVINAPVDNGDGTLSLTMDAAPSGTVAKISLAEQLRFDNGDNDELDITWDGGAFTFAATARTVEDVIVPPPAYTYDTIYNLNFAYGPPPPPVPTDQEFAPGPLGQTTLINVTTDRSLSFGGIFQLTPPTDGMVVTINNVNNSAFSTTLIHEDTTFSAADRLLLFNQTTSGGVNAKFTFVYNGTLQRWIQIA